MIIRYLETKYLVTISFIFLLLPFITFNSYAQTSGVINACYSNGGVKLRIVANTAECKSNENPLTWNISGPPGPTTTGYSVYDSTGQLFGPAITIVNNNATVIREFTDSFGNAHSIIFGVSKREITTGGSSVYFESSDCSGQVYGQTNQFVSDLKSSIGIRFSKESYPYGSTARIYAVVDSNPVSIVSNSFYRQTETFDGPQCVTSPGQIINDTYLIELFTENALEDFPPPFEILSD